MKNGLTITIMGDSMWFKDDKLHREDGPAYVSITGRRSWYINGKLHRVDGPADIYEFWGYPHWYYNGKRIDCSSQEEFEKIIKLKAFW